MVLNLPWSWDYFCAHCLMEPVTWWTNGTDNQEADTSGHKRSNTIFLHIHSAVEMNIIKCFANEQTVYVRNNPAHYL